MISRKLHRAGFLDFSQSDLDLRDALNAMRRRGLDAALKVEGLSGFDRYVLRVFFDGITPEEASTAAE